MARTSAGPLVQPPVPTMVRCKVFHVARGFIQIVFENYQHLHENNYFL